MEQRWIAAVRAHVVLAYFAVAYGVTWMLWLPLVASRQGWWSFDPPEWLHYAGAAGPVTGAFVVAGLADGRRGWGALLARYRPSKAPLGWLVAAAGSVLALSAVGIIATRMADGAWPSYADIAKTSNLPAMGLPLTMLVHLLTFGIGEETGWRGFALPHLQERWGALRATALLYAGWALWHLPSFFENPTYSDWSAGTVVGWASGLALGAVFLTWLYNSARGSLLTVVMWHALFNTVTASEAASTSVVLAAVVTTGVMAIAVIALIAAGPAELRGWSRRAGPRVRWSDLMHGLGDKEAGRPDGRPASSDPLRGAS
ncbi:MAG: CPBP family glutamic-type intramembrane protease [Dehalococcoidia bacterium]